MIAFRRVNGDVLTIKWSTEGTLSTAILDVDSSKYNVASQLPGLREENCEKYLEAFGFFKQMKFSISNILRNLKEKRLTLSSASISSRGVLGKVILESDRSFIAPTPLAIARFSPRTGRLLKILKQTRYIDDTTL